jgi:CYTH domain-containing protein
VGIEIERKFLVDWLPPAAETLTGQTIRQGYVIDAPDGTELRVRQKQAKYYQTIKTGAGISRTEIEMDLTLAQFDQMWPHTEGRRVSKTRYTLPVGKHTAELDRFDGDLAGLMLVEVEFDTIEAAEQFSPPDWFGLEVTEDKRYKNKHLAAHGIPESATP